MSGLMAEGTPAPSVTVVFGPVRLLDRLPWWLTPLAIFVLTRLLDALVIAHASHGQVPMDGSHGIHVEESKPADPGYFGVITNWDGQWYDTVARHGYPRDLPQSGPVPQTAWAFYPLYPSLVRVVMIITPFGFAVAASVVSLAFAGAAMVLLYRMVLERGGRFVAAISVLGLCVLPSAPILQTAYTEGLALFLIMLLVWALSRRRYDLVLLPLVALALTRPIVIAAAPLLVGHAVLRWRSSSTRQRWQLGGLVVASGALMWLWPAVAGLVTGRADAYLATQKAWGNQLSLQHSYLGWFFGGGSLGARHEDAVTALFLLLVLLVTVIVPAARVWPVELRLWALGYALYLMFALRPTSSIERYLLLVAVPWLPLPALVPAGTRRWVQAVVFAVVLALGVRLQIGWVGHFLVPTSGSMLPP
jgi:hypothetical protein